VSQFAGILPANWDTVITTPAWIAYPAWSAMAVAKQPTGTALAGKQGPVGYPRETGTGWGVRKVSRCSMR